MTIEQQLAAIEARLRSAEDRLAIQDLISRYGPLVDSGQSDAAAALWSSDGTYDVGGMARLEGQAAIAAIMEGETHQALLADGVAHLLSPPHITLNGDSAEALCHSFVARREGDRWIIWRASANRFRLERTAVGWAIAERINRPLDGSKEARALFLEPILFPAPQLRSPVRRA